MDRLQHLTRTLLAAIVLTVVVTGVGACDDAPPQQKAAGSSRFAAVQADKKPGAESAKAASTFCERTFPIDGPDARMFKDPPQKPIPGYTTDAAPAGRWKWVNLWATWCAPCLEEMGLLAKWQTALGKDIGPIDLELWSLDAEEKDLVDRMKQPLPGRVRWLRSQEDIATLLESLGVAKDAAIPIHALVDPSNHLRCVRVGSVHDGDYPAVKALLAAK